MKVNQIGLNRLRNDANFQFHTEFKELAEKLTPEALKIKPQFEAYLPLYNKVNLALKKIAKSSITEQIFSNGRYKMKKAIAFLAFAAMLTLSIGCGNGKVVQLNELQKRGDVYVVPETQKPYSGKFITTYYGNIIREAGALKNGKLHGEITTYRENGSIDNVITFANGVLNGKRESYHENGKLMRIWHYKDGNPDRKWEKYDKNGQLIWTIHYENGIAAVQRGSFSDQRDGKTYKTVKIGLQTWMAENLNYNVNGSKCYKNEESNCQKYGRLYDLNTAMTSCPSGWRLPSSSEWEVLVEIADGYNVADKKLKAKSGWNWADGGVSGNGKDEFGFSALPGGKYYKEWARFIDVGNHGYWWSSSKSNNYSSDVYYYRMDHNGGSRMWSSSYDLYSVRCLQELKEEPSKKITESEEQTDKQQSSFTDSRDGKTYKSVKIGNQTWMAENLNYNVSGSKCYDGNEDNCTRYGRLYNWATAIDVCPSSWHLPSDEEWTILENYLGGSSIAGKKLKSSSGWSEGGGGTDDYGFSALPGGRYSEGKFGYAGNYGSWWSTTESNANNAYMRTLRYDYSNDILRGAYNKSQFFSVRCLKD